MFQKNINKHCFDILSTNALTTNDDHSIKPVKYKYKVLYAVNQMALSSGSHKSRTLQNHEGSAENRLLGIVQDRLGIS